LKVASQNGYKNIVNMLISATKNGRI
jgi:hypothetical protein